MRAESLTGSRHLDLALELVAATTFAATLVLSWHRLRYGVDLSDESFYAVVTQRYVLGDRPYVDEVNLRQTSSLLTVPFYWLYLHLTGGTDGVMLFLRHLYLGVQLLVAACVYRFAVRLVPRSLSLLAAALPVSFVPFTIPAPSYNTLGALLFAAGMALSLSSVFGGTERRALVVAGVLHGLASVAYAPLGLVVLVYAGCLAAGLPDRWRGALRYVAGVAGAVVCFAVLILPSLVEGLPKALAFEGMLTRPRTWDKVGVIFQALVALAPTAPAPVTTLAVAVLLAYSFPRARGTIFIAAVLLTLWHFNRVRVRGFGMWADNLTLHDALYLGLLTGVFALFTAERRAWLLGACLPGILAGLVTALASDNRGCMNAGIGLASVMFLVPIVLTRALPAPGRLPSGLLFVGLAVIPLWMVYKNYQDCYYEGPVVRQTTRVDGGPFSGMYTDAGKAKRVVALQAAVKQVHPAGERMVVYWDNPGIYLMAAARPALPIAWTDPRTRIAVMLDYYRAHRTGRGTVVVLSKDRGSAPEMETLVEVGSRLLLDGGFFKIYREPPP